jgi:phospholipase D1/2
MGGKPYKVGRFAHSLRVRLMREHVGVDVDAIEEDQLMDRNPIAHEDHLQKWDPDHEQNEGENNVPGRTTVKRRHARDRLLMTVQSGAGASMSFGLYSIMVPKR